MRYAHFHNIGAWATDVFRFAYRNKHEMIIMMYLHPCSSVLEQCANINDLQKNTNKDVPE